MKKFTQYLKCEFSATEIADKAKELATANRKRGSIEAGPESWTDLGSDPKEPR
jgi:hypothetical protein